jgi:hypothetical protein
MIEKLKQKNLEDLIEFFDRVNDIYSDFYITKEKNRLFFKNNWELIEKTLKYQEVYGIYNSELKGLLIIIRDKGYRPYVKLLSENSKYTIDLLKFLKWNFIEVDLYFKLKKGNPLSEQIKRTGFTMVGDRGKELLFFKKRIKSFYKITPKDDYIKDEEHRLY